MLGRMRGIESARGQAPQLIGDPRDDAGPVAALLLAEETHRGIPGAVLPLQQPAPVGREGKHRPYRLPQCPREMRYRRAGRNHQIELADRDRRVAEVIERRPEIDDPVSKPQGRDLPRALALLEAEEA